MLFNSIEFPFFLTFCFVLYWSVARFHQRIQNGFLLLASYVFYGWWDFRFLGLIVLSSLVDYAIGLGLDRAKGLGSRRTLLVISLVTNLGILGFFKYFNFFLGSFAALMQQLGLPSHTSSLAVILPVGVSFYTFQSMSYTIDVYRGKLHPCHDAVGFLAFVAFFPQLVAGPIERATHLLPQFKSKRFFDPIKAEDGLRQILWGLFKKVVVADSCAVCADFAFASHDTLGGPILVFGAICFAFQIYCDFSGYSHIAIGTARLFGFDLMENFSYPYFSRDIGEFWRRWHISLSTWFRDYVYLPLGGNRRSKPRTAMNIIATFTLSGFWHGASWTFVWWGLLNSLFYLPLIFGTPSPRPRRTVAAGRHLPNLDEVKKMGFTFGLICLAWIFFRSDSLTSAFSYIGVIFSDRLFQLDAETLLFLNARGAATKSGFLIAVLLCWEWFQREKPHGLSVGHLPRAARWGLYYLFAFTVFSHFGEEKPFIYFQF